MHWFLHVISKIYFFYVGWLSACFACCVLSAPKTSWLSFGTWRCSTALKLWQDTGQRYDVKSVHYHIITITSIRLPFCCYQPEDFWILLLLPSSGFVHYSVATFIGTCWSFCCYFHWHMLIILLLLSLAHVDHSVATLIGTCWSFCCCFHWHMLIILLLLLWVFVNHCVLIIMNICILFLLLSYLAVFVYQI